MVDAFVEEICARNGIPKKTISQHAMDSLINKDWSGNVRELRNIVERLVIMAHSDAIERAEIESLSPASTDEVGGILHTSHSFQEFKDRAEAAFIRHQLELHNWNVSKTAETLEMERSHLYTKIKKYGLEREGRQANGEEKDA
jgi:DNA-binding NtrC family response regulator